MKQLLVLIAALAAGVALAPIARAQAADGATARQDASAVQRELTMGAVQKGFTGDLGAMRERRLIRALVAPARTQYWLDRGQQTGVEFELLTAFEKDVNTAAPGTGKTGAKKLIKVHVAFIPTRRDKLIADLLAGKGDVAAGVLTATPERLAQVDFAGPFFKGVRGIAVSGPQSAPLASLDGLAGREVFVRRSSSYWTHLEALNQRFRNEGKAEVRLRPAPEDLQDDDLLEMLSAGLFDLTVVDRYAALLWAKVLPGIRPHDDVTVNDGGEIGWMIRKGSPELKTAIDDFARRYGQGTTFGNTIIKKYTGNTRFVTEATAANEVAKFRKVIELFRKYGSKYELDYLLMAAQGYQESRLDQEAKSQVGAIGVMQVMPATGKDLAVGDVKELEPNVHAGVKYMRTLIDKYFGQEPMDMLNRGLFAFASYNAGPGRIRGLRKLAAERGLDANVWFNNVELVVAERVGAETVGYVSNIYKYYVAYRLMEEQAAERNAARETMAPGARPAGASTTAPAKTPAASTAPAPAARKTPAAPAAAQPSAAPSAPSPTPAANKKPAG